MRIGLLLISSTFVKVKRYKVIKYLKQVTKVKVSNFKCNSLHAKVLTKVTKYCKKYFVTITKYND
jgi:hypothetical protein